MKPQLVVALGATAVRGISGRLFVINKIRWRVLSLKDGGRMLATIHPSCASKFSRSRPYKSIVTASPLRADAAIAWATATVLMISAGAIVNLEPFATAVAKASSSARSLSMAA